MSTNYYWISREDGVDEDDIRVHIGATSAAGPACNECGVAKQACSDVMHYGGGVHDPELVICEPSYGLPSVARIERVTTRDIVLEGGRRARRKTLRLEGGDKWASTRIKHLDAKRATDDA